MEAAVELVRRELNKRAAKAGRRAPRGHKGSIAVRRDRDDGDEGSDGSLSLDTTDLANDALAYLVWASQKQYRMSDVDLSEQLERAITLLKKRRATAHSSKTSSHGDPDYEVTVGAAARGGRRLRGLACTERSRDWHGERPLAVLHLRRGLPRRPFCIC